MEQAANRSHRGLDALTTHILDQSLAAERHSEVLVLEAEMLVTDVMVANGSLTSDEDSTPGSDSSDYAIL